MPVSDIFAAVLESLIMLTAPKDPEVVRQVPSASFVAAKNVRNNFAVVTRVCHASWDCHTFCVDVLRIIVVRVCVLCIVNLQAISTDTDSVIKVGCSTNPSSIIITGIDISVIKVYNSKVLHFRALLLWIVSIEVECNATNENGTDLGPITNNSIGSNTVCL